MTKQSIDLEMEETGKFSECGEGGLPQPPIIRGPAVETISLK